MNCSVHKIKNQKIVHYWQQFRQWSETWLLESEIEVSMESIQDYCMNFECHCLVDEVLLAEFVYGDMQVNFVKQYVVQLSNFTIRRDEVFYWKIWDNVKILSRILTNLKISKSQSHTLSSFYFKIWHVVWFLIQTWHCKVFNENLTRCRFFISKSDSIHKIQFKMWHVGTFQVQ